MRKPYRIESITLQDIGVFEHIHFDFPKIKRVGQDVNKAEIHIFTGPNGCGKSTLLYALAAIFDSVPFDNELIKKRFRNTGLVDYRFDGLDLKYFGNEPLPPVPGTGSIASFSSSTLLDSYRNSVYKKTNSPVSFAAFAYSGNRNSEGQFRLDSIKEVECSPFENALSFNSTVRIDVLAQWIANNRTKHALSLSENELEEAEHYQHALKKIGEFIFDVSSLNVSFSLKRKPLEVVAIVDGQEMRFEVLPEGLKSIISWVADLSLRLEAITWKEKGDIFSQPVILFLDEVDIHLHPKWQRRILPAIQKLLPEAQVFVSTHSPFVVGSVEDAWVYRLPDPQCKVCRDPSVPEVIAPVESGAGKSYQLILEEVFDVSEQFDVETEQLLKRFKECRDFYLQNPQDDGELMMLADKIRERGDELEIIIEMELRQIARRLKG